MLYIQEKGERITDWVPSVLVFAQVTDVTSSQQFASSYDKTPGAIDVKGGKVLLGCTLRGARSRYPAREAKVSQVDLWPGCCACHGSFIYSCFNPGSLGHSFLFTEC